jgi:hypothetical protein
MSAVLITDVVSSETCPELGSWPERSLGDLLNRIVRHRNFFHGINPAILGALATLDPALGNSPCKGWPRPGDGTSDRVFISFAH